MSRTTLVATLIGFSLATQGYALPTSSGTVLWNVSHDFGSLDDLQCDGVRFYVQQQSGALCSMDAQTGMTHWCVNGTSTEGYGPVVFAPTAALREEYFYAPRSQWFEVRDVKTGKLLRTGFNMSSKSLTFTSGVAVGDVYFATVTPGISNWAYFIAVNLTTMTQMWQTSVPQTPYDSCNTFNGVFDVVGTSLEENNEGLRPSSAPQFGDSAIYFSQTSIGCFGNYQGDWLNMYYIIDAATGNVTYTTNFSPTGPNDFSPAVMFVRNGIALLQGQADGQYLSLMKHGPAMVPDFCSGTWNCDTKVVQDIMYQANPTNGGFYCFNITNGQQLCAQLNITTLFPYGATSFWSAIYFHRLPSGSTLSALNLTNPAGKPLWTVPVPPVIGESWYIQNVIADRRTTRQYFYTVNATTLDTTHIVSMDVATGRVWWIVPAAHLSQDYVSGLRQFDLTPRSSSSSSPHGCRSVVVAYYQSQLVAIGDVC